LFLVVSPAAAVLARGVGRCGVGRHRRTWWRGPALDNIVVLGYAAGMSKTRGYPGGKSGSGVYQRIISQMPPHECYVEPFLGGGSVMRHKRPARFNLGIDLDCAVVARAADLVRSGEWISARAAPVIPDDGGPVSWLWYQADAVDWLARWTASASAVVYCDPPYLMSTRSSHRRMYRFELDADRHRALLAVLVRLPCFVLLSGYDSEMYNLALSTWRVVRYPVMTRGGRVRTECLWLNYPEPAALHDYRYLGRDYRERERIRRKEARWVARLSGMPVLERRAVESALAMVRSRESAAQEGRG
jgi:DNA adenine methylase